MKGIFGNRILVGNKDNVTRISQKIEEEMEEHKEEGRTPQTAWVRLTDILRMQVFCKSPKEVKELFLTKILPLSKDIQIMRFKPRFSKFLNDMIINFNYMGRCVAELQIKLGSGDLPKGYEEQHFVYECLRSMKSRQLGLLVDTIRSKRNTLLKKGNIVTSALDMNKLITTETVPGSLQHVLKTQGQDFRNIQA
jgi:hypothetical protein